MNDPNNKYVVPRADFRRIPRWVNDGIEQFRRKIELGETEVYPELTTATSHPDQKALAELMGGWFFGKPLHEMGDDMMGRGFALSLPFITQQKAAEEQSNLEQAKSHLVQQCKAEKKRSRSCSSKLGVTSLYTRHPKIHAGLQISRPFLYPSFRNIWRPMRIWNSSLDKSLMSVICYYKSAPTWLILLHRAHRPVLCCRNSNNLPTSG